MCSFGYDWSAKTSAGLINGVCGRKTDRRRRSSFVFVRLFFFLSKSFRLPTRCSSACRFCAIVTWTTWTRRVVTWRRCPTTCWGMEGRSKSCYSTTIRSVTCRRFVDNASVCRLVKRTAYSPDGWVKLSEIGYSLDSFQIMVRVRVSRVSVWG